MAFSDDFVEPSCWEVEMDTILINLDFPESTRDKFKQEKILVSTVPLLTDNDLVSLGVQTVGERAELRKKCRDSLQRKKVNAEVRSIMGPSTSSLYCALTNSLRKVTRKPKRKAVGDALSKSKKGRVSSATFQKKLVVFKYMGEDAPNKFTRADRNIVVRGLLPAIMVEATEEEIRKEIGDVIRSEPDFSDCGSHDFEFIDMSGKQASVPQCKTGFSWDGRAVRELAGSGCLYVRLTSDIGYFPSEDDETINKNQSSDSDSMPSFREISSSHSRSSIAGTSSADRGSSSKSSESSRSPVVTLQSSLLGTSSSIPLDLTQTPVSSPPSSAESPPPAFQFQYEKADPFESLKKLSEFFPHMTTDQLSFIYNLPKRNNFNLAVECIMEGPSFESLCDIACSQLDVPLSESPRIRVDKEDEGDDLVAAVLAFYKDTKFVKNAPVRISMGHQPGIDTGGLRRQVFSEVFENIAMSSTIAIFDGPQDRLRPAFKASSLSSGMLTTMGTMIGHSILMDRHGFPYFAEYCYYYMAGCMDKALTCITTDDVSDSVKALKSEIEKISSDADMAHFYRQGEILDLMEKSGCDLPLSVQNKKAIVECIIIYDALHKRTIYLDAFCAGLEVMGIKTMISLFPELCKPAFVADGAITSQRVTDMLKPHLPDKREDMNDDERRVWQYLVDFASQANEEDLKAFLMFITGCRVAVGKIAVSFVSSSGSEAIAVNTCGRQLTLSTHIQDKDMFVHGLLGIIPGRYYTMP